MATRQETAERLHELAVEAATDADREQVNAERRLRTLETTKAKLDDIAEARMAEADAGVEAERALLKELQALRELEDAYGRDTTAIEASIASSKDHIDVLKLQTKALKKLEGQLKSLRDEGEQFIENALGMDDALIKLASSIDETEGGLKAYA